MSYAYSAEWVVINLITQTVLIPATSEIDTLFSIEAAIGSQYNDSITGNSTGNFFEIDIGKNFLIF